MAIFHLSVKAVQRSKGRSSTAAAAYRAGERITDERTEKIFDFSRKGGVCHTEIIVPEGETVPSRSSLWNLAEATERRKDAQTAKEYELALPSELTAAQRIELAENFARSLATRYGCALDVCIHEPSKQGDQRNYHAHIMATTRVFRDGQLAEKTDIDLSDRDRKKKGLPSRTTEIKEIRQELANIINSALEKNGHAERVDPRSFKEQGREDEPTIHLGAAVTAMERKGDKTEVGDTQRAIIAQRSEKQKLQRKAAALAKTKALLIIRKAREAFALFLDQEIPRLEGNNLDTKRITAHRFLSDFDQAKTDEERQNVQKGAQDQVALHKEFVAFIREHFRAENFADHCFNEPGTMRDFDRQDTTEGRKAIFATVKEKAAKMEAQIGQRAAEEKAALESFTAKLQEERQHLGRTEQEQDRAIHSFLHYWRAAKPGQRTAVENAAAKQIAMAKEWTADQVTAPKVKEQEREERAACREQERQQREQRQRSRGGWNR